jgi:conjugal transfer pilus assembly protein TraW
MVITKYIKILKNLKSYIKVSILLLMLAVTSAQAKNLGVWGPLFPIEEQDIREFIYQRLNEMEQNGEMTLLNKKFIKNVKEHALRPTPVAGLTVIGNTKKAKETKETKTFYYDPTYILNRDIEDYEGNIIAKKGTIINPLDTITLHGVLFFLDADDKRQIKWALSNAKKYDYVRYILVKGNIKEAGKKLNDRIYFDQYGLITKQLGIKHIPCIVKQEGKKLQIQEFVLKESALEDEGSKQNTVLAK